MKKLPKIIIITFLSVFIIQMIGLIVIMAMPEKTKAANEDPIKINLQVPLTNSNNFSGSIEINNDTLGKYIVDIYKYAIGVVGILAAIIMMYGGVVWITAFGSADRISEAQSWIRAAITGVVLALSSFMILYMVNPDLTSFKSLNISSIGCCTYTEDGVSKNGQMSKSACESKNPKGSFVEGECSAETTVTTVSNTPTCTDISNQSDCDKTNGCWWYEGKCAKNYTVGNYCCVANSSCSCFTSDSSACGSGYTGWAGKQCASNGGSCGYYCK